MAAALLALVLPASAGAGVRMYVGFQDDPSFRWAPDRAHSLDRARAAGASVIRSTVHWADVARTRPASAADPFDPAYRFDDVDEFVRAAQQRGIEVLLTIWNTPEWANGGKGGNYAPDDAGDLTAFAQALAARYSGRYAGFPFVRFFSVWNEPNTEIFLAPQFDERGRSVAPARYAELFAAAYEGLKAGSPSSLVAIGETSWGGRDRPSPAGSQDRHSPGRFARLVAEARPDLRFDAWAHHPYPPSLRARPLAEVRWPQVSLGQLDRFGRALDRWFDRKVPLWVSEYAHQSRPQRPDGVPYAVHARYAAEAITAARRDPRVQMFVWFVLRDRPGERWQSGLLDASGAAKPAFGSFRALAQAVDIRNAVVPVRAGAHEHVLRVPALELKWHIPVGARVGVRYSLHGCGRSVVHDMAGSLIEHDGWVTLRVFFQPQRGRRYRLDLEVHDIHGFRVRRSLELVGVARGRARPARPCAPPL